MNNLVYLDCFTSLDIPADRVLEQAVGQLEHCIVLGKDKNGKFYFASSMGNHAEVLWDLEHAKKFLFELNQE